MVLRKARRAARWSSAEWRAVAAAFVWLAVVRIGLKILGYARTAKLLDLGLPATGASGRHAAVGASEARDPEASVSALEIAVRNHPGSPTCLERAMVLARLLRGQGLDAQLTIGVRRDDGKLDAHAWVELDGRPVGERVTELQPFTPLRRAGAP